MNIITKYINVNFIKNYLQTKLFKIILL